jgi:hypothetical protein
VEIMNGYTIVAARTPSDFPEDGQIIIGCRTTLYDEIEYVVARRYKDWEGRPSRYWYGGFYTLDFQRAIDNYTTR